MKWDIDLMKLLFSFVGGIFAKLVGGYDPLLNFLMFIMMFDIISGFMRVYVLGEKLNANIMFIGGIKKITILLVIMVSVQIDFAFSTDLPIREIVIMYYVIQEFISFSQNISSFMSLPKAFTDFFEKKGDNEK